MNAPNLVSQPRICGLLPFPPVPLDDAHSRSYGIGSSPAEAPSSAGVQPEPCETFRCCSCYDNWPPESPHQTQPPVSPPQPPLPPPPSLAVVDSQDQQIKSMSVMDAHNVQQHQRQHQHQQLLQQWQHRQYQRQYRDQQKRRQVKPEQLLSLLERVCTIRKPHTKRRSRPPGQTGTTNAAHEWSYRETPDWRAAVPVPAAAARRLPDLLSQTTTATTATTAMTPGSRPPPAATETTTATVDRKQTSVGRYMAAMNLGGGRRYDDDHDEDGDDRDAAREGPATDANGGPSSFWRRAIGRCVCPRGEEEQEGADSPKAVDIRFTECGEMFVDLR
ncbi:uncharacterized protein LOC133362130 [Lethenteron reissneri]|uniref:uncharacterized protein LOC133362130 n=1 Tax=Lethenteron reissneri TaxID=7753 RepID=UPI002AB6562A|nr:uncharacterized protein LOC133362130 [Lethenteron reissneri]